jgi:hypothetical protein
VTPPPPWTFAVDELVAAGIDEIGVFQPLLRTRIPTDDWPVRRRAVIEDLEARGLLTPSGSGWAPTGELATILLARAASTCLAVVTAQRAAETARSYLLGRFAGPAGLLRLVEAGGSARADFLDATAAAAQIEQQVRAGARVTIDVQRLIDPDIPMRRLRVILGSPDEQGLTAVVVGRRDGEDTTSWESRLDTPGTVDLCARALIGDDVPAG